MRILIAEDDAASRIYLAKLLEGYGDCDFAQNGIETVQAYARTLEEGAAFDLICLDIMMPKIDGIKALKAIREIEGKKGLKSGQAVKVMLVSALNESEIDMGNHKSENDRYLVKPIMTEEFYKVLDSMGISRKQQ